MHLHYVTFSGMYDGYTSGFGHKNKGSNLDDVKAFANATFKNQPGGIKGVEHLLRNVETAMSNAYDSHAFSPGSLGMNTESFALDSAPLRSTAPQSPVAPRATKPGFSSTIAGSVCALQRC